jgi:hypothetical protein
MAKAKTPEVKASEQKEPIPKQIMRILKVGTCTNVSGKHKLTYHIACNPEQVIHFRIYDNSGGGSFSGEWVALKTMQDAIEVGPKPTTSFALFPLFTGKSINTPAFLLAALMNEGLMEIHAENQRCYATANPDAFMAEIKQLMDSDIDIKVDPLPKKKHHRIKLFEAGPVNTNLKKKPGRPYDSVRLNKG